jgi:hypothetical protein
MGCYVELPQGVDKDEVDKILRDKYGKGLNDNLPRYDLVPDKNEDTED